MKQIIQDVGFETLGTADSKWQIQGHQGVDIQHQVEDGAVTLTITGTSGVNWHGEFKYQPFEVKKGNIFEVSFSAKAKTPFKFSVWLGQANAPFASLVSEDNHYGETMMLDDWECFTHTWTAIADEPDARLIFVLGPIDNVVEIEDISLLHIDQVAQ